MPADRTAPLLIEIGCEELPPTVLNTLSEALYTGVADGLEQAGIAFQRDRSRWFASPRRLAMRLDDVAAAQPDQLQERRGPALDIAFDADGQPTPAAEGFARSVGRSVADLDTLETEDGRWLYCRVEQPGQPLAEVLFPLLEKVVRQLPVPRPMRWSDHDFSFIRPVHWLVVLHGDQVLDGSLLGQDANRMTRGHRIHSPGPHAIESADDYERTLLEACVVADPALRRQRIHDGLTAAADQADLAVSIPDDLLDEVTNINEWPVVLDGQFDEGFLSVPAEALIASMQDHQKFFPMFDRETGRTLQPRFLAVANLESTDPGQVRAGYERVITPRLADAQFFWRQDLKTPLADHYEPLGDVVFQKDLGSLRDKSERIAAISKEIAELIGADSEAVIRAARLSRCDLLSLMVGEFPELQGIMGHYYAAAAGEPDDVAAAIESFYAPRQAGDALPADEVGRILAVADRLDTLAGVFAAGLKPTGNKDPFALRRAGGGLLRILAETRWPLTIEQGLDIAAAALENQCALGPDRREELRQFITDRLRTQLRDAGHPNSLINAVLAAPLTTVADAIERIEALAAFLGTDAGQSLAAANKRIGNILRKADGFEISDIDEDRFDSEHESALFNAVRDIESQRADAGTAYSEQLDALAALKSPVDRFFDEVMVMTDDDAVRQNRLSLLARVKAPFDRIADLGQVG